MRHLGGTDLPYFRWATTDEMGAGLFMGTNGERTLGTRDYFKVTLDWLRFAFQLAFTIAIRKP